jgi:hypothetical protein
LTRAFSLCAAIEMMLDASLTRLYGVPVKAINQAVGRNAERFPADFAYRLGGPASRGE